MGVGKTTIAQLLSEKTKIKWLDLDELIEKNVQLSIKEIFEQHGEIYFRKLEHELFKDLIENEEKLIISTGGGTPCYANNHLFLNGKNTESFYLKASIGVIFERLKKNNDNRPLIVDQSEEELKEFIAKTLFERSYFYTQASHKIEIDNKSSVEIVYEIVKQLN